MKLERPPVASRPRPSLRTKFAQRSHLVEREVARRHVDQRNPLVLVERGQLSRQPAGRAHVGQHAGLAQRARQLSGAAGLAFEQQHLRRWRDRRGDRAAVVLGKGVGLAIHQRAEAGDPGPRRARCW